MQKAICLVCIVACLSVYEAVEVSEKKITATDGTTFDVTEVVSDNTDVVILKKNGVIVEHQITEQNKGYVVTKLNDTCNVEFDVEDGSTFNNTCYEGRTPDTGEITDDIKEECGDLEVRFIKVSECPKDHMQKRYCYYCCYWRYRCCVVWWRKLRCRLERVCYRFC